MLQNRNIVCLRPVLTAGVISLAHSYMARTLSLMNNRLSTLPDGIFERLTRLEWLYLDSNELKQLPFGVFDKLPRLK